MKIEKFEEIISWNKAKKMTVIVYKSFSNCNDYGFKDQIQRASVSIINNIAEGFERKSIKEFKYFLYIAKGSCGRLDQCYISPKNSRLFRKKKLMSSFHYLLKYQN